MMLRSALRSALLCAGLVSALGGCSGSTLDSLGGPASDGGGNGGNAGNGGNSAGSTGTITSLSIPSSLQPVTHSTPQNAFSDLLGKDSAASEMKIKDAYTQLFHGSDGLNIFNEQQGAAIIFDYLHNDIRTEGIGLGMLIAVELGHDDDFDNLWRYSKTYMQETTPPAKGYFRSTCGEDVATDCYDVYGMQLFAFSLMLAHRRWGSTADMPYESDALALLDVLVNKEAENGGIKGGIGNAFSLEDFLVREEPTLANAGYTTRSSLQMPAIYSYWAKATGMPFWSSVEKASRELLVKAADSNTGLWPMRSYFDGTPVSGTSGFTAQAYRTQLNLALDALWSSGTPDQSQADLANKLLTFFNSQGVNTYGGTFDTDGTPGDTNRAKALVSVNGALVVAVPTSNAARKAFAQALWDQPIPTGNNRYYEGLMYLTSMLIMSGQMKLF